MIVYSQLSMQFPKPCTKGHMRLVWWKLLGGGLLGGGGGGGGGGGEAPSLCGPWRRQPRGKPGYEVVAVNEFCKRRWSEHPGSGPFLFSWCCNLHSGVEYKKENLCTQDRFRVPQGLWELCAAGRVLGTRHTRQIILVILSSQVHRLNKTKNAKKSLKPWQVIILFQVVQTPPTVAACIN
jgi:hypothetical protein